MPNRNVLKNNIRSISQVLSDYDNGNKTHDDLLKAYNRSIKQLPDHYNKEFDNKRILPTTVARASDRLYKAVKVQDPKLLHVNSKKYMQLLHKAREYGLWTLYDYDNDEPVDSSPERCHTIVTIYQNGLQKELDLIQDKENEDQAEF